MSNSLEAFLKHGDFGLGDTDLISGDVDLEPILDLGLEFVPGDLDIHLDGGLGESGLAGSIASIVSSPV